MATSNSHHFPLMNWSGDQVFENFKLYERKLGLYFEDEGITDGEKQARKILRSIGDEGLRLLDGSALSDADQQDPAKLLKFIKDASKRKKYLLTFMIKRAYLSFTDKISKTNISTSCR